MIIYDTSYSHPATKQDVWVLAKLGEGPKTFVEVGAFDGMRHSNTLLLEEHGWSGVLIDAVYEHCVECCENRPECEVIYAAVGPRGYDTLVIGGQYSGLKSKMPQTWLDEHHARGNMEQEVETKPLSELIDNEVDYLSVDTEGGEHEIIRDWFESGGRCRALTVEFRYDMMLLHKFERLLGPFGLELNEVRGFDACFLAVH